MATITLDNGTLTIPAGYEYYRANGRIYVHDADHRLALSVDEDWVTNVRRVGEGEA